MEAGSGPVGSAGGCLCARRSHGAASGTGSCLRRGTARPGRNRAKTRQDSGPRQTPTVSGWTVNRARQPATPVPNRKRAARTSLTRSGRLTNTYTGASVSGDAGQAAEGLAGAGSIHGCSSSGMVACTRARGSPGRKRESKRPSMDATRREREAQGMLRNADRCEDRSRGPRAVWPRLKRGRTHHESDSSGTERNRSSGSKRTGYSGVVQLTPGPRDAYAHARTTERTAGTAARTCLCHDRI